MNKRLFTGIFFLVSAFFMVGQSYACPILRAVISPPELKWAHKGYHVGFDGSGSVGAIYECTWSLQPEGEVISYRTVRYPDDMVVCEFNTTGVHTVTLTVTDREERTDSDTCLVNVVAVDMVPGSHDQPWPNVYIAFNYDDDDSNGVPDRDQSGTVAGEDDLFEIQLSVDPTDFPGEVELSRGGYFFYGCLKVWSDPDKQNLIIPNGSPYSARWSPAELPPLLYVEGFGVTSIRGAFLLLFYVTPEGVYVYPTDLADFTVVEVDVDMDGVKDWDDQWPQVTEEIMPGGFIALNDDDDNNNEIPDKDENGPVTDEDDLVRIELKRVLPSDLPIDSDHPVTFDVSEGGSKIKIWQSQTKGGSPLTLPATYTTPSDFPEELWVEGFEVSSGPRDIELTMQYGTFEDRIKVTVVKMDLDVDSDNNNGFNQPARDENEDEIEDDDSKPGKYIMVNDDDNDDDGIPDFADGFNRDETNGNDDDLNSGEKFVPLVFEVKPGIDATKVKIKFTYSDSDPAGVTRSGTAPNYTYTPAPGTLRIWTKDGNVSRNKASAKAATPGDFVEAGTYTAEQLGFSGTVGTKVFYVEAIAPSASLGATRILVEVDPYGGDDPARFIFEDAVRMTAIKVDVDVDTDNNNGLLDPDHSLVEDHYEDKSNDSTGSRPGKYVEMNSDDDDNDGIPDFADGFDRYNDSPGNADDSCTGEGFVPLVVDVAHPIDLTKVDIKVTYSASDPSGVNRTGATPLYGYSPAASGNIRIWTKDGWSDRNKASVKAASPGDYVETGTYDASQLGFEGTTRTKTFYVEGIVAQTNQISDVGRIIFEVDPDGAEGNAGWVAVDKVRTMVIKSDIDMDTDNNGSIEDCDDPVEDKSPGAILPKDLEGDGAGTDYREEIKLKVEPAVYNGQITLDKSASGIKIWTASTGGTEVSLPATYNPGSLPASLWVDGTTKGSKPDITLEYKDKNNLKVAEDKLKVLVTETISWAPAKGNAAHVWSSLIHLGTGDGTEFENQIDVQGFDTDWYEDSDGYKNTTFNDCTLANYKNMKNCGAFTVISHGEAGKHLAVYAEDGSAGQTACTNWMAQESGMTVVRIRDGVIYPNYMYAVEVESTWHSSNWASTLNANKAIAMWSICYSATGSGSLSAVKEAAGGRWRSGYIDPTDETEAIAVNKKLLKRMNGTWPVGAEGTLRTAGEAWSAGGYTSNVMMDGNNWTTLCPAPMEDDPHWPSNPGARYGWGCIIFDTYMNDTISPSTALIKEYGSPSYDHDWRGDTTNGKFMLGFNYDNTSATATAMKAVSANCKNKDPDGGRQMDANRKAPNGDVAGRRWTY